MTFAAFEASLSGGSPVELYEILLGSTFYRWASGEEDYTFGGEIFTAAAVERSAVQIGAAKTQDILTFTISSEDPFPRLYVDIVPGQRATMTIRRLHRDDPDQQAIVLFKGIMQSVAYSQDGTKAMLAVRPLTAGLSQRVPRYTYQGLCNHFLFDARCKVVQNSFKHTGIVTGQSGVQITVNNLGVMGTGWSDGGFVQLGSSDFRLILKQTVDTVNLLLPFPQPVLGSTVDVFAGCAHTIAVCKSKFNNVINYGGFAFVPLKNIFQTGLK